MFPGAVFIRLFIRREERSHVVRQDRLSGAVGRLVLVENGLEGGAILRIALFADFRITRIHVIHRHAIGRLTSPEFAIDAARLTMRLGGAAEAKLRVELWTADSEADPNGPPSPVVTASVLLPGGDTLREVTLDVSRFRGKPARLVLVDDSETGHLVIDDVWLRP